MKGDDVVDSLNRITAQRGLPKTIKTDNLTGRLRQLRLGLSALVVDRNFPP